jgi:hypothetical protein
MKLKAMASKQRSRRYKKALLRAMVKIITRDGLFIRSRHETSPAISNGLGHFNHHVLQQCCTCIPQCHHLNTAYLIRLAYRAPLLRAAAAPSLFTLLPKLSPNFTLSQAQQHHDNTSSNSITHNHGSIKAVPPSPPLAPRPRVYHDFLPPPRTRLQHDSASQ